MRNHADSLKRLVRSISISLAVFFLPIVLVSACYRLPSITLDLPHDFERSVVESFPIGSNERALIDWLDNRGFPEPRISSYEAWANSGAQVDRSLERRRDGNHLKLRILEIDAFLGRHYYSVSWRSDGQGQIEEIYAQSNLFHFDVP
jgi:hypothetical protein